MGRHAFVHESYGTDHKKRRKYMSEWFYFIVTQSIALKNLNQVLEEYAFLLQNEFEDLDYHHLTSNRIHVPT